MDVGPSGLDFRIWACVCVKRAMRGLGHVGVRIRLQDFGWLLRKLN